MTQQTDRCLRHKTDIQKKKKKKSGTANIGSELEVRMVIFASGKDWQVGNIFPYPLAK